MQSKSKIFHLTGTLLVTLALVLLVSIFTLEMLYAGHEQAYSIGLGVFAAAAFASSAAIAFRQLKRGRHAQLEYYNVGLLRFVTSTVMLGYAFTKLYNGHMYLSYSALDTRLNELSDFDTVWGFYGRYSSLQALLGIMELLPAILLLFRRTALAGALILLPVIANVAILNVYYRIGGLTLPVSGLLLLFDCYIIYSYKSVISAMFAAAARKARPEISTRWRKTMSVLKFAPVALFISVVIIRVVFRQPQAPINGAYELTEFTVDGRVLPMDSLPADCFKKIYFEKRRVQSSVLSGKVLRGASIRFRRGDSVLIAFRDGPIDAQVADDTTAMFLGKFEKRENGLVLSGKQSRRSISGKYTKLSLREFDYWWQQ